jgi:catechol 2,3-dioxygenase-like lactoylglutathione lyase family enzyme
MIADFKAVEVISLFVEDLQSARHFYTGLLDLTVVYEDQVSCVVKLDNLMLNLLQASEASELVTPRQPGAAGDGPRFMITVATADANAMFSELSARGITFLNGPIDRPWGRRTAAFTDPAGIVWEIAQELPPAE